MRVSRAARSVAAVSVAGVVSLALYDDSVSVVAIVTMDEQGEEEGKEEEDAVPGECQLSIPSYMELRTYMMPNAKLALSIAHCLSMLRA